MTKNPFGNAIAAVGYIALVAAMMFYGSRFAGPTDTIVAPIAMLSLFTLSAAVMGYLFLYQPLRLYFDGNKQESVSFFLKTVAFFAAITVVFLGVLFSGALR